MQLMPAWTERSLASSCSRAPRRAARCGAGCSPWLGRLAGVRRVVRGDSCPGSDGARRCALIEGACGVDRTRGRALFELLSQRNEMVPLRAAALRASRSRGTCALARVSHALREQSCSESSTSARLWRRSQQPSHTYRRDAVDGDEQRIP
eukprot:scaffold1001_cov334-Prasinococcus_capsulatus_cf.AAC.17